MPVPPLTAMSVPARVMVPEAVIGPPDAVKPVVPPDTFTEVTVPVPVIVDQVGTPPTLTVSTCPLVPIPNLANVLDADE